jgi:hypothetical protein
MVQLLTSQEDSAASGRNLVAARGRAEMPTLGKIAGNMASFHASAISLNAATAFLWGKGLRPLPHTSSPSESAAGSGQVYHA